MEVAQKRSAIKALTWRIIGSATLALVVYFLSNKPLLSIGISVVDLVSNFILYYSHERLWNQSDWGRFLFKSFFRASRKRMAAKTITWRIVATLYLLIIVTLFTRKPFLSVNITLIDALLNTIEYYGHEWLWNYIKWGRFNTKNIPSPK